MKLLPLHSKLALAAVTLCLCVVSHAQQAPLTGQMLAPTTPASPRAESAAGAPAAPATPVSSTTPSLANAETPSTEIGSTTRALLSMQADGSHAGQLLPIPGQEASASYARYLKSFEHPIPVFFETAVPGNKSGFGGQ